MMTETEMKKIVATAHASHAKVFLALAMLALAACGGAPGDATGSTDAADVQLGPALPAPTVTLSWFLGAEGLGTPNRAVGPALPIDLGRHQILDPIQMVANRVASIGCWTGAWSGDVSFVIGTPVCAAGGINVRGACVQPTSGLPGSNSWASLVVHSDPSWTTSGLTDALAAWGTAHCGYRFDDATLATLRTAIDACVKCELDPRNLNCTSICK